MTNNIIFGDFNTRLDIPVERVCEAAKELETVVILGIDKDGELYFASSANDKYQANWLADKFKQFLLSEA